MGSRRLCSERTVGLLHEKKQQPNILYTTPVLRRRRHGLHYAYSVNQKLYSPYGFLAIFPQRLRILK